MSFFNLEIINYDKILIKTKSFSTKVGIPYTILETAINNGFNDSKGDSKGDNGNLYRSVIINPNNNTVLSYSPPVETDFLGFKTKFPDLSLTNDSQKMVINEMIEGIMIHLFYDKRIRCWDIATKSAVGGDYWFFRTQYGNNETIMDNNTIHINPNPVQLTFRQMFLEALNISETGLSNLEFDKLHCYNFILQHPHNHIVFSITKPTLYLVNVYEIRDENAIKSISQTEYENWEFIKNIPIQFPQVFCETNYDTICNKYCSINSINTTNPSIPLLMGIMITNSETGERTSIKNKIYENHKEIRGNNPNLQFQYYCLCRMNKVQVFLDLFPEYNPVFAHFKTQTEAFITNIHNSYYKQYVAKYYTVPISYKYRTHIYKIHHEIFIPSKQLLNKIVITRKIVREYFDNLEPKSQLHSVNL